jgi:hypothetical protein
MYVHDSGKHSSLKEFVNTDYLTPTFHSKLLVIPFLYSKLLAIPSLFPNTWQPFTRLVGISLYFKGSQI